MPYGIAVGIKVENLDFATFHGFAIGDIEPNGDVARPQPPLQCLAIASWRGFDVFFMFALAVVLLAGVTLLITQLRHAEQQALPIVAKVVESLVIPRPVLVNKVIKYRIPNHDLVSLILVLLINVAIIRPQQSRGMGFMSDLAATENALLDCLKTGQDTGGNDGF